MSVSWLAEEVRAGRIRWVLGEASSSAAGAGFGGRGLAGDSRQGSRKAIAAAEQACKRVTVRSETAEGEGSTGGLGAGSTVLYDCQGRSAQIARLGT